MLNFLILTFKFIIKILKLKVKATNLFPKVQKFFFFLPKVTPQLSLIASKCYSNIKCSNYFSHYQNYLSFIFILILMILIIKFLYFNFKFLFKFSFFRIIALIDCIFLTIKLVCCGIISLFEKVPLVFILLFVSIIIIANQIFSKNLHHSLQFHYFFILSTFVLPKALLHNFYQMLCYLINFRQFHLFVELFLNTISEVSFLILIQVLFQSNSCSSFQFLLIIHLQCFLVFFNFTFILNFFILLIQVKLLALYQFFKFEHSLKFYFKSIYLGYALAEENVSFYSLIFLFI